MANSSTSHEPGLSDIEARLRLFESLISHTSNGIVITAPDASILFVNASFMAITGYRRDEVLGKNMRILHSGRQSKSFYEGVWTSLTDQGSWSGAIWNRRKDGECYQEWLTINAIKNERQEIEAYVGIFSDISSIRSREHELENLAYVDPLTELPNRLLFRDRLNQALAYARRDSQSIAVLIIDLDGVESINRQYGYLSGDRMLQGIAQRIDSTMGECDTAARLAGDEFAVILSSTVDAEQVAHTAETILSAAAEPLSGDESIPGVAASIGVATFPHDAGQAETLLEQARLAMYAAKRKGGARVQLYGNLHTRIEK